LNCPEKVKHYLGAVFREKYDYSFKLECVELVLKKHYSIDYVFKQKGGNKTNISDWVCFMSNIVNQVYSLYITKFTLLILNIKFYKL